MWRVTPLIPVLTPTPDAKKSEQQRKEEEDAQLLEAIKSRRKLASDMELAKGIQYTEPLKSRYAFINLNDEQANM